MAAQPQWIRSFNPTLVRLRLSSGRPGSPIPIPFQSHAGSIEALPIPPGFSNHGEVSIPRWFD